MKLVNEKNYPFIFKAFQMIDYENGLVNRYVEEHDEYSISLRYSEFLSAIDLYLSQLNEEDFETFCIGEANDILLLIDKTPYLTFVSAFLNDYFNEWETHFNYL